MTRLLWFVSALLFLPLAGLPPFCAAQSFPSPDNKLVIVGGDYLYPPYEFLDEQGNPTGYNVELTRRIAEIMGIEVEVRLGPWNEIRSQLETGGIDAIHGMFYSQDRDREVDFTPPHAVVHHAVFTRVDDDSIEEIDQIRGMEIIVMQGDIMHDYAVRNELTDTLIVVETQQDALRLLASGRHDCVLAARLPGLFWIKELRLSNLIAQPVSVRPSQYCYAVREGDAETLALFTEGLAILKSNGEYNAIHSRWLGVYDDRRILPEYIWWAALIALSVIGFLLSWLWLLRRQIHAHTRVLRKQIEMLNSTQHQLALSEKRFRDLAENAHDVIYRIKLPGGAVDYINPACKEISGYPAEAFYSEPFLMKRLIDESQRDRVQRAWDETVRTASARQIAYSITRKDGSTRELQERLVPICNADGQVDYMEGIIADVTELRRMEEEKREFETQLLQSQKLESLGVLAGGIAHDFNNILMTILGNADLALESLPLRSPAAESVQQVVDAARRASILTRQMLAYSGKGRFVVEPISVNALIRDMADMLRVSISSKISLQYEFTDKLPHIHADIAQMQQVMMNLISNAAEAVGDEAGRILIVTHQQECDVDYLNDLGCDADMGPGTYVIIEVSDNGCGMDDETSARMFEPFFTSKFMGRGLGMAAVQGIVRGHHGCIRVYSEPGKGTTIKLLFPAIHAPEPKTADSEDGDEDVLVGKTVLLADDESLVRDIARRILASVKMHCVEAEDGAQAIQVFKERKSEIDAVILDLTMPVLDGREALRELKRISPDIRVLLSSGYNQQDVTQEMTGRGRVSFIQKPYTLKEIKAKLIELFMMESR